MISAAEAARLIEDAMMRGMDLGEMNGGIRWRILQPFLKKPSPNSLSAIRRSKKYKGAPYYYIDADPEIPFPTFDDYCQVFWQDDAAHLSANRQLPPARRSCTSRPRR